MIKKEYEKFLKKVQKPARYTGGEYNEVIKDKPQIDAQKDRGQDRQQQQRAHEPRCPRQHREQREIRRQRESAARVITIPIDTSIRRGFFHGNIFPSAIRRATEYRVEDFFTTISSLPPFGASLKRVL